MLSDAQKAHLVLSQTLANGLANPWYMYRIRDVDWAKVEAILIGLTPPCDLCGFKPSINETLTRHDFGDVQVYFCERCK